MERLMKCLTKRHFRRFIRKNFVLIALIAFGAFMFVSAQIKSFDKKISVSAEEANANMVEENVESPAISVKPTNDVGFKVHFIDVGQGDSALVECDGKTMLIDAGDEDHGSVVVQYLNKYGITHLDYIVASHPDSDHIGGMPDVIGQIQYDNFLLAENSKDNKSAKKLEKAVSKSMHYPVKVHAGNNFALGSASVFIVGPVKKYKDDNNNSLVLTVTYQGKTILFTGDAEAESEQDMIDNGAYLKADVLKCGHHGSKTSSTPTFLAAVAPQSVIISCGKDNKYGHPHSQTLSSFINNGYDIYRTDMQGSIILCIEDGQIVFDKQPVTEYTNGDTNNVTFYNGPYVLNTNSKKFHLPDCAKAGMISEKNKKISYENRNTLINSGYSACGFCNP